MPRSLRGATPGAADMQRLKALFFGAAGVGKTTAAIQMPRPYIIDCERGTEHYGEVIAEQGGAVYRASTMLDAIEEVRTLLTSDHEYLTCVIDPFTLLYDQAVEEGEAKEGTAFGKQYGYANRISKRLYKLLAELDMNVVVICHGKFQYDKKGNRLADTFDGWKRLDYLFDLVFEIARDPRSQKQRLATVRKTRLSQFPDGSQFPWSHAALVQRLGDKSMGRKAEAVELAGEEELTRFLGLYSQLTEEDVRRLGINRVLESPDEAKDLSRARILRGIEVMEAALNPEKA